ncbi:MAG: sensor histidine kinase, partial [Chloroflexi bacterium]
MQNKPLAQWLQDHTDMLGSTADPKDSAFHRALFEGLIDLAQSGETRMVNSVVESAAAHAVAVGRPLTDLLGVHQRLRRGIWDRIREEIDPEPAFDMLTDLDAIFVHVIRVTIDAYQTGVRLAQAAKSTEISRLYSESEQKVMKYATEVSRANRELARLEQAKTDFISIAAHELKTPLTLIQGYVDILHGMDIGEQGKTLAAGIDRGVQRMDRILDDMLDLSAMDMRKLQLILRHVNLEKTIRLVIAQSERSLNERGQTITTHGLSALPEIEADANRLHQVFRQLLNNAIKYTPDGGTIAITGKPLGPAPDEITGVRIAISDTGVGIAPEHREKIFEKFYRASDSSRHSTGQTKFMGAGPGLGLAIVKGLVEAHGGRVSAESPGFDMQNCPGSKFVIDLPCKANPPADIGVQWIGPV